jgi:hypothetical protein
MLQQGENVEETVIYVALGYLKHIWIVLIHWNGMPPCFVTI